MAWVCVLRCRFQRGSGYQLFETPKGAHTTITFDKASEMLGPNNYVQFLRVKPELLNRPKSQIQELLSSDPSSVFVMGEANKPISYGVRSPLPGRGFDLV